MGFFCCTVVRGKKKNFWIFFFDVDASFELFCLSLFPSLAEKMGDVDGDEVACLSWTNKQPKVVQPDLNYIGGYGTWVTPYQTDVMVNSLPFSTL